MNACCGSRSSRPPDVPHRLFQKAERWFQRGRAELQDNLPCRQGCDHCCHGTFAITMLDQIELQYGLGTVPAPTREKIDARARSQVAMMQVAFPRLARSAYVDEWDDADLDDLVTRFNDMPCPALDSDGSCLVYGYRPLTCRMMGLPVEINGLVQGACDIQTSVPLIQITHALRQEEEQLIGEEAMLLAEQNQGGCSGEEILLPYGFVPASVA